MYQIEYASAYLTGLKNIPTPYRIKIKAKMQEIASDPYGIGKKLKNKEGRFACRVGKYRIIYEIFGHKLLVVIYEVGHRKDVYDNQ